MIVKILKKIKNQFIPPAIDISDEYINWLCFANAGMLHRGNLYSFEFAIQNIQSQYPIVEIGSFCGLSTNAINYYLHKNGKINKLITCDNWDFEGAKMGENLGNSTISHLIYRKFVKETYMRNIKMFSKNNLPYTIEVNSDKFFEIWENETKTKDIFQRDIKPGGKISFCYIDGDHTYENSKRDFENTDKYLEKGGFILFDDSSDNSNLGCAKLMKEILSNSDYELVIKNPNYLFRKKRI